MHPGPTLHDDHAFVSDVKVWVPPPFTTVTEPAAMFSGFGLKEVPDAVIVALAGGGGCVVGGGVVGGSVGGGSVGGGSVGGGSAAAAAAVVVGGSVVTTVVVVVEVVVVVVVVVVALLDRLDELDAATSDFPPPQATSALSTATAMHARTVARTPVDTGAVPAGIE